MVIIMKTADHKSKKEKRGLYFALAVCLLAVGIAAFGTYNSISDYVNTRGEEKSGTLVRETDPEAPKSVTDTPADPPAVDPVEETPAETPEEPANTEPESEPETEPEESLQQVDAPAYSLRDQFVNPVSGGEVTTAFSGDALVYNETMKDHRTHQGADFTAKKGDTVYAANNGVVKKTYHDMLLGNVIIIEHGDYDFWYCGLGDTFLVKEGEVVSSAKAIGSVTTVPSETTDTHLHLQVEKDSVFLDPATINFE